jgi:hypothetical protein
MSLAALCAAMSFSGQGLSAQADRAPGAARAKTLAAFGSEKELIRFLSRVPKVRVRDNQVPLTVGAAATSAPVSPSVAQESVTNAQHAGVDEGGIVKLHGQHLVVLRRGRLFTVSIANGDLQPVSAVNAFGPDIDAKNTWYDELLVSDRNVVVIGYSYQRVGTELGIFDIDAEGRLTYRSTHHVRSNDYFSSRNYASRLIGNKLILYSPLELPTVDGGEIRGMPGVRDWKSSIARGGGGAEAGFVDVAGAANIYYVPSARGPTPFAPAQPVDVPVMHTVTTCDLGSAELQCKATALIGNLSEVFYVSPHAVYVWTGGWGAEVGTAADSSRRAPGTLYRMPLDGSPPQALGVSGAPVDQLSFDETGDGFLNVVVRARSRGDWMGNAELSAGEVSVLHLPIGAFGDGTRAAASTDYRRLPAPEYGSFQNRFVHGTLLYGGQSQLFVVDPVAGTTVLMTMPHDVGRIEAMGDDAVVIGADGKDLHFSGVRLVGRPARVQHYVLKGAAQGDTRTHGFFYKPSANGSGLLGLPVVRASARDGDGDSDGSPADRSASVLFLQNADGRFDSLGQLVSSAREAGDDECVASCVDWYGNARPLFVSGRVLALMGYEIVEGRVDYGAMREVKRVTFAPRLSRQQAARH